MPRQQLIKIRKGSSAPAAADFQEGEPAWDSTNKKLYVKAADGSMVQINPLTTIPSGSVVGTTDTQTLTSKTFGNYTETVYTVVDGGTVNLDPNNGPIQTWTLGASRTPGEANWAAGQSITLLIDDGSAYSITWSTLNVTWKTDGGTAPTLNTSGFTVIVLWKVGSTIYGARVGDA